MIGTRPKIVAGGMLRTGTPVEDYRAEYGLFVKREDLACPPPGPPFSKTRGVYAWVAKQEADLIGVLDTYHSQAGHAVARACQVLGKRCLNFYPEFKREPGPRPPQLRAAELGAELVGLPAGRSAILYHQARKQTVARGGVMIVNALKLEESVAETAKEVGSRAYDVVLIPASSGTIAAGVMRGMGHHPLYLIHMGYSRSKADLLRYVRERSGLNPDTVKILLVDEGYEYKDVARPGETPPWPCNCYYDLKCFRWWLDKGRVQYGEALFWSIG
jgi:hypothetical protein